MLTVHHLNTSRSQRIVWLLEELELPYEIRRYQRDARTLLAPPELKAVHPLGKSPLLGDGDIVVAESGAIIEYLLENYGQGRLQPAPGTTEHRRYRFWLHYAEGSLMPLLLMKLILSVAPEKSPALVRPLAKVVCAGIDAAFPRPQLKLHLGFVESELATRPWLTGDTFTAADVQMSFPLEAATARVGGYPRIAAFVARLRARPAYQRALARGGPNEIL